MTKKNVIQVVIGGKVLSMCGSEDELHIQRVASCVNRKLSELEPTEGYRALPMDLKPVLVELNLADDLISAQETIDMLKADLRAVEDELSEVKQKLSETQIALEELESSAVQMTFSDIGWMPGQMDAGQGAQTAGQETTIGGEKKESESAGQPETAAEEVPEKPVEPANQKPARKSSSGNRRKSGKR